MPRYIIDISDEEEKAMLAGMVDIRLWISNFVHNKARKDIDRAVLEYSEFQPDKITPAQRLQTIRDADIKTAAEKNAEFELLEEA